MAGKTFSCCICGNEVSKRKSFAMPDGGRACETHPEAQAAAEASRKEVTKKQIETHERFQKRFASPEASQPVQSFLVPHCFCCNDEGIQAADHYARILNASEKMSLQGFKRLPFTVKDEELRSDPEYTKALRDNMKSKPEEGDYVYNPLFHVDAKEYPQVYNHLRHTARFAVDITGYAIFCGKCCEKTKVKPKIQEIGQRELSAAR